jgi:PPOX class probable F420-dependent enzyme
MDHATERFRMGAARVGHLATVTSQGRPHIVPCCFVLDDNTVYSGVDAKQKSTLNLRRIENLRTNCAAALLVDHYDDDWSALWWIRVDGIGRIVDTEAEHERALRLLAGKYPQYRDVAIPGPTIAIDVKRWISWP